MEYANDTNDYYYNAGDLDDYAVDGNFANEVPTNPSTNDRDAYGYSPESYKRELFKPNGALGGLLQQQTQLVTTALALICFNMLL